MFLHWGIFMYRQRNSPIVTSFIERTIQYDLAEFNLMNEHARRIKMKYATN